MKTLAEGKEKKHTQTAGEHNTTTNDEEKAPERMRDQNKTDELKSVVRKNSKKVN